MDAATRVLVKTTLQRTKSILSTSGRWTKGAMAKDSIGNHAEPTSPEACKWCLSGAVVAAAPTKEAADQTLVVIRNVAGRNVVSFNDDPNTGFWNVRSVLEKADAQV